MNRREFIRAIAAIPAGVAAASLGIEAASPAREFDGIFEAWRQMAIRGTGVYPYYVNWTAFDDSMMRNELLDDLPWKEILQPTRRLP